MECERLKKLIKGWYIQVQDEAMAPARMADFMKTHLAGCQVCRDDRGVDAEIKKIIEIILPSTKIPKAVRKEDGEVDFGEGLEVEEEVAVGVDDDTDDPGADDEIEEEEIEEEELEDDDI